MEPKEEMQNDGASSRNLDEKEEPMYIIMVDAADTHTQVFIFEYEDRVICTQDDLENALAGTKLTYLDAGGLMVTKQIRPPLASLAYTVGDELLKDSVKEYLQPIWDFVEDYLADRKHDWGKFPMYLGGAGGIRMLPRPYRERLMDAVGEAMGDYTFNQFYFKPDMCKVLSGEEQAAYQWATFNVLMKTLTSGDMEDGYIPILTKGVLRMTDASTEFAFLEEQDEIMSNSYKFQLGHARSWDLYAHSFLFNGAMSAMERSSALLSAAADPKEVEKQGYLYHPCLPGGVGHNFTSRIQLGADGNFMPLSNSTNLWELLAPEINYTLYNPNPIGDYEACQDVADQLLIQNMNKEWCDFEYDNDCSLLGLYQPPAPTFRIIVFGTDWVYDTFYFLGIGTKPTVDTIAENAKVICEMDMEQLIARNVEMGSLFEDEMLPMFCFVASWLNALINKAFKFPPDFEFGMRPDPFSLPGSPSEWAYGFALHYVNTYPWRISPSLTIDGGTSSVSVVDTLPESSEATATDMEVDDDDSSTVLIILLVVLVLVALAAWTFFVQRMVLRRRKARTQAEASEVQDLQPTTYGTGDVA